MLWRTVGDRGCRHAQVSLAGDMFRNEKAAVECGGVPSIKIEAYDYNGSHLMNAVVVGDGNVTVELRRPAARRLLRLEIYPCASVPIFSGRRKRWPRTAQKRQSFAFLSSCIQIREAADLSVALCIKTYPLHRARAQDNSYGLGKHCGSAFHVSFNDLYKCPGPCVGGRLVRVATASGGRWRWPAGVVSPATLGGGGGGVDSGGGGVGGTGTARPPPPPPRRGRPRVGGARRRPRRRRRLFRVGA